MSKTLKRDELRSYTRRHHALMRGVRNSVLALLAIGAVTGGSIFAATSINNSSMHQEAERQIERNAFFSSLGDGGLDGDTPSAKLSRAVSELLGTQGNVESSNPLTPSTLETVYVAPGLFEGITEEMGEDVFAGIKTESSRSSFICEECGEFTDSFKSDVRAAWDGDLDEVLVDVQKPQDATPWLGLTISLASAALLGQIVGWIIGRAMSVEAVRYGYKRTPLRADLVGLNKGQKALLWVLGWPWLIIWQAVSAPGRIRARHQDRKALKEERRKNEAAEMALLEGNPVSSELLRARANIEMLETLPQILEVKEALKAAKAAARTLERMPQDLNENTAISVAKSIQAESEDMVALASSIKRSQAELQS